MSGEWQVDELNAHAYRKFKSTFAPESSGARPLEHPGAPRRRARLAWGIHARLARGGITLRSALEQSIERRSAVTLGLGAAGLE